MAEYELRVMPVEAVRPADYNPRVALRPGDPEYEKLRESVDDLGVIDPLVWNETTGRLVGGHQRLQVCIDLGWAEVPVFVVHLSEEKEIQANLALNKISGRFDESKLRAVLQELKPEAVKLAGFDPKDLRALYDDGSAPLQEDDFDVGAALAAHEQPRTRPGDVILLGEHRLMCGDATSRKDAEILFDGHRADMVFTDPPYNVDYHGSDGQSILNDKMAGSKFYQFLLQAFTVTFENLKPGGGIYICHADSEGLNFRRAMCDAGFLMKQCLVWVKNSLVLGRQDYQWQHEPILYGWKPGAAHCWYGGRKQTTAVRPGDALTVEKEKDGSYTLQFTAGFSCIRVNVPEYKVTGRSEDGSVWLFDKPSKNGDHPTMKPISLCGKAIANSSERGEIVADLFAGSGSTLMAAEQLGRRCCCMELDPRYCDVIVERYRNFAGGGCDTLGVKTERQYKNEIVKRMQAIGTYREEFLPTIDRLAMLYCQRDKLELQYSESGGNPVIMHTNKAGATNPTKNPFLTARDEVYSQLLSHERELGLTPSALKKMNEQALRSPNKASGFAAALTQALDGAGG